MNSPSTAECGAPVFDAYARYYDLLYRDKDYAGEAKFVSDRLKAYGGGTSMLELGCGTGRHGMEFARLGYQVTGVDLSKTMVQQAVERASTTNLAAACRPEFSQGDVRRVRLGRTFDIVVSLFHVMSYQTSNEDLRSAFQTASVHLKPGGLFLFDFWYGPAVLSDPPVVRVKRLDDAELHVTRIAEPEMRPNQNQVVVNYEVFVRQKQTGTMTELRETHAMRYLFLPEITAGMEQAHMKLLNHGAWERDHPLGVETWYGWAIARHR